MRLRSRREDKMHSNKSDYIVRCKQSTNFEEADEIKIFFFFKFLFRDFSEWWVRGSTKNINFLFLRLPLVAGLRIN